MDLAATLRAATSKVVPGILDSLAKSTVTTTRMVKSRDAAQRPVNTPTHPVSGARWYVREVADAHVQRVWGMTSNASAEAAVPITTDVQENDVVLITAGDFAGNVYEIQQLRRDLNGSRILIALAPTGQTP